MDYGKIKEAAQNYQEDMVKFLRAIVKNPGESCDERKHIETIEAEMKKIIKELIQKYIGVEIDDSTKNCIILYFSPFMINFKKLSRHYKVIHFCIIFP